MARTEQDFQIKRRSRNERVGKETLAIHQRPISIGVMSIGAISISTHPFRFRLPSPAVSHHTMQHNPIQNLACGGGVFSMILCAIRPPPMMPVQREQQLIWILTALRKRFPGLVVCFCPYTGVKSIDAFQICVLQTHARLDTRQRISKRDLMEADLSVVDKRSSKELARAHSLVCELGYES